jgi:hypothetical protein
LAVIKFIIIGTQAKINRNATTGTKNIVVVCVVTGLIAIQKEKFAIIGAVSIIERSASDTIS